MINIRYFFSVLALSAVTGTAATQLPALLNPEAWIGTDYVTVSNVADKLQFSISAVRSNGVQKVLLKEPVKVPEGEILSFSLNSSRITPAMFNLFVRDAKGLTFVFRQSSIAMINRSSTWGKGSNYLGGLFRGGLDQLGEVRVHVEGMRNLKNESYFPDPNGNFRPVLPLEILGFTIHVERETALPANEKTQYWMDKFTLSSANSVNDDFFAVFKDQKIFGAADEFPEIFQNDVISGPWGNLHELEWELRDKFDGQPITNGTLRQEFAKDDPRPYKLRFDKKIVLQKLPEGSYWVKVDAKSGYRPEKDTWNQKRSLTFRYDVFRNTAYPSSAKQKMPDVPMPKASEPFVFPDGIPTWKDVRDGKDPLVLFAPMIHEKNKWTEHNAFLYNEMIKSGDSKYAEIQNKWSDCEPAPGKYDFSYVLGPLDEAQKRGVKCFVTFAPLIPPEWMPSIFTKNKKGEYFGHTAYTFHGGRMNLFQSKYVRDKALAYLANLVLATRNHPACLGYFFITEHSGEAPWAGWFEGFDDDTLSNFRNAMKAKFGKIGKANEIWQTNFSDFDSIMPPDVNEQCTLAFRRDWLLFRRVAVHNFIVDSVELIRKFDDKRIIMCYGDGILYSRAAEIAKYGVITANGGCDNPDGIFYRGLVAEVGMPQRAEEISCSNWKARGETQIDESTFGMLGGGGANTHFKMFTPQGATFDSLRNKAHGLDRFEMFIPIWKELRGTKPIFGDLRIFESFEGAIAGQKTASFSGASLGGWSTRVAMDSQLCAGLTSGSPKWKEAKAVWAPPGLTVLSREEAANLTDYVKRGGTLLMSADCGRHIVEEESNDWNLLQKFGFPIPTGTSSAKGKFTGFDGAECLGDKRITPASDTAEILMTTADSVPALTSKSFGKGHIYILWFSDIIPYGEAGMPFAKAFLPEVFKLAGIEPKVETECRLDWVNLLKKDNDTWYLFTTCSPTAWSRPQPQMTPSRERWFKIHLPDGNWSMTDLITGETRSNLNSDFLAKEGFKDTLAYRQVRIWRFKRQ